MKKALLWALVALFTFSLTSCNEDEEIARTLEGTWKGDMYIEYEDYYNNYYTASYSEVYFEKDPFTYASGYGYEIDYFSRAPWDYICNHTEWKVRGDMITIYLVEDNVEMDIRNYRLDGKYFRGEVFASDGSWREFHLVHTSSPNWNNYHYGLDYWERRYYSKQFRPTADLPTVGKPQFRRIIRPAE